MSKKNEALDGLIQMLEAELAVTDPETEGYKHILERYEKLTEIQRRGAESKVDPNTLLVVVGNLVGVLAMLNFERLGVITSKAAGHIIKPKMFK